MLVPTVYGLKRAAVVFGTRPDLRASGRILLASLGAAVPTIVLIRLDTARNWTRQSDRRHSPLPRWST